jgi:hypothetical protein
MDSGWNISRIIGARSLAYSVIILGVVSSSYLPHVFMVLLSLYALSYTTTRPVKLMEAYLLPTRPLIESDLTKCLSRGFLVLMTGDLKAKHTNWNSRLITARGSLLP